MCIVLVNPVFTIHNRQLSIYWNAYVSLNWVMTSSDRHLGAQFMHCYTKPCLGRISITVCYIGRLFTYRRVETGHVKKDVVYDKKKKGILLGIKQTSCCWYLHNCITEYIRNMKVVESSAPRVETFSVSKTLTLPQECPFVCQKWMLLPAQLTLRMLTLLWNIESARASIKKHRTANIWPW